VGRLRHSSAQPALELELPAVPEAAPRGRRAVREVLGRAAAVDLDAVDLAVSEAVTNVVIHAYSDRDDEKQPGRVRLAVWLDDDGVSIVVADSGRGMSPREDSPGAGLGLGLIATLCDDLQVEPMQVGTHLCMRFGRGADPGAAQEPPAGSAELR
jgi:anti-sigma regulatory factor (Ser/Thr protein kinase)